MRTLQQHSDNHQAKLLKKDIAKQIRKDRRQHIMSELEKQDEFGYSWKMLKTFRKRYTPKVAVYQDHLGNKFNADLFPKKAAEYYSNKHWAPPEVNHEPNHRPPIWQLGPAYKTGPIERWELDNALRKAKNNKTPGPDNIAVEYYKHLSNDNTNELLQVLNQIYSHPHTAPTLTDSNLAIIFKKGNPSKLENYRPISLLQTNFKLIAAIIRDRATAAIDQKLMPTQYGFRAAKSTSHAIFLARRIMERCEAAGTRATLVLLDWEKAFDKVSHGKLQEALTRLDFPPQDRDFIRHVYTHARFTINQGDAERGEGRQSSGIKQGCPLSPFLFVALMHLIFHDIKSSHNTHRMNEPFDGIKFSEILYADDTLIFGPNTHCLNKLLHAIQAESAYYNLKLNLQKCENISMNVGQARIRFQDGTLVPRKTQATYLGANLNDNNSMDKEIASKIAQCKATANKLGLFWSKARADISWKIQVANSILRSKLLYGLETAHLSDRQLKRLNAFQHYMLRRCMGIPPAHIDHTWNNARVMDHAETVTGTRPILFTTCLAFARIKLLGHIIRAPPHDPLKQATFGPHTLHPNPPLKRRRGRPRTWWLDSTIEYLEAVVEAPLSDWESDEQDLFRAAVINMATERTAPFSKEGYSQLNTKFGHLVPIP